MSVVGFDVGNDTSCVALARKRGIDVLLNKESKRETPAVVNFSDKMRFLGTDGSAKIGLSPQNTVHQLKRILGKKFKDPEVQADIARLPFNVTEGPDGGCLVNVQFLNEPHSFTPEQLMAMVLVDLKKIAESEAGISVTDCCIAVPVYYTEAERYALLNAAQIAGVNCLRLINENTATALAYGIYKTDLPENDPVHVAFVDIGHSATQVSIVSLKKTGLLIKSHAWDNNLGGRDFDEALFDHFCAEFKAKNKIDIKANKKASFKLRTAVEKLKKVLSANAESPLNVECIMDDTDVRGAMNRDTFEELIQPQLARLRAPLEKALAESGLKTEDLASVEIVGSSTRIPAIARIVEDVFKKAPSRTMNSKECVSRGAALQCAMLSPVFKVREFAVVDACPYTVEFLWDRDGEVASQRLFEKNSPFPISKVLTLFRNQPFAITSRCVETGEKLGEYQVGPFQVPAGSGGKAKLKVKVNMNLHGLVQVESVQQSIEEEEVKDVKMEDAPAEAPAASGEAAADAAPMDTDGKPAEAPAAGEVKKKVKKLDVPFQGAAVSGYSQKQLDDYFEQEAQMQATDRLQEETNERKNALEGYVYSLRNKLYDQYAPYVKEQDKENLVNTLQTVEDWLYDEGEDCTKSVYIAKLDELKKIGAPVEQRYHEDQTRPAAVEQLKTTCDSYVNFTRSDAAQFAHITSDERASVMKECQAAMTWLNEKLALQSKIAKTDDPVLLTSDIAKKRDTVDRFCRPIATKPAPKPTPPPAPAAADAPPAGAEAKPTESEAAPMDSETPENGDGENPAGAPKDGVPMDI